MDGGEKKHCFAKWAILALIVANLFVWLALAESGRQNFTEVRFFDVGQGDAAFVQTARGTQIIIDGGPGTSVLEKLGRAMPFYDRQIDWMILSHPDGDHLSDSWRCLKITGWTISFGRESAKTPLNAGNGRR